MKNIMGRGADGRGRSRWLWVLGVMVFLGVGAWGLWGHRPPPPPPKPAAPAQPRGWRASPSPRFMKAIKPGSWRPRRRIFTRTRHTISISGVRVEFFGPGEDIRVKADAGLFNTKTRVLTLKGQVEMRRGDLLVQTSVATYVPAERVLLAPERVVITEPGLKVEGRGLRVELAAKKLVMAQHHLTELQVKDWRGKK